MWHLTVELDGPTDGVYRAIFRHEGAPTEEVLRNWMERERETFKENRVSDDTTFGVIGVTTVVLQKKLVEGDLTAWATISLGRAFQNYKDQFSRREGRVRAYRRAIGRIESEDLRTVFEQLWNAHSSKDELYPEAAAVGTVEWKDVVKASEETSLGFLKDEPELYSEEQS